jgi:tetratricopeptide (TPR) repeat protein
MSFFKKFPLYLILVSYLFLPFDHIFSDSEADKEGNMLNCSAKSNEFLLSMGMSSQSKANQANFYNSKEVSQKYHKDAIRYFEKYIECTDNKQINAITHLNLASSYIEVADFKSAELQAGEALKKNPYYRDAIFFHARLLTRQGKLEAASQQLESKISYFPEDSDFLFLLGSLNRELNHTNKAILYFTSLLDSIQKREGNGKYKVHCLKNLGDLYFQNKELKKSLLNYQAYLLLNPRDTDARFQVAQIFNLLGDFGASKRILQDIHEKNPSNLEVELLLAEMNYVESKSTAYPYLAQLNKESKLSKDHLTFALHEVLLRHWKFADGFLREFLPNHTNRIAARLAWLDVLEAKYSKEDYAAELKTVSELSYTMKQFNISANLMSDRIYLQEREASLASDLPYSYWFLANCMEELKSPNRAILYSKKAIALSTDPEEKSKFNLHLGHLLLSEKIKRLDEAKAIADKLLKENPKNHSAYYLNSYAFYLEEKYKPSLESINQAIEQDSENIGYIFQRALIYEKLNNFPGQEKDLKLAIELNSENPITLNYLGFLYAERNEHKEEALAMIQKAVDLEPDNGAYQDSLGWIYFKMGRLDEALFHLSLAKQMLADQGINDPTVYDHIGDVYYTKDDIVNAKDYWKKAKKLSKNKSEIDKIEIKIQNTKKDTGN